jgi:hypothetical protein
MNGIIIDIHKALELFIGAKWVDSVLRDPSAANLILPEMSRMNLRDKMAAEPVLRGSRIILRKVQLFRSGSKE